jgi:hypothetical protein
MQHFQTPTRLLDWTDGALLALYFAVRGVITENKIPKRSVVWAIDPMALNKTVLHLETIALPGWKEVRGWLPKEPYEGLKRKCRFPIAIDPTHVDLRLAVQRSHFTLFGRARDGLAKLVRRKKKFRLARIAIARKYIPKIVDQLEIYGIKETSVFPDLEGLSREIRREWSK